MSTDFTSADALLLEWASNYVEEDVLRVEVEHEPSAQIGDMTWDSSYTHIVAILRGGGKAALPVDLSEIITGMGDLHREKMQSSRE
jgi:hypothetical protein